jgi:hypothetical protein
MAKTIGDASDWPVMMILHVIHYGGFQQAQSLAVHELYSITNQ